MVKGTDEVLEILEDLDVAVPIGVLDLEIDLPKSQIARALNELGDRGYIEKNDEYSSFYQITEKGRGYLAGEVDASEDDDES